ncbi:MAG: helix-turn-helix transcriptional regulator [Candidatus Methanoplasma sp.]|jgi:DNA-binding HxlR family transcriptional regulator|nr:helix-turn-helix transcriptional regulator [Candidatus Methanoplasma sp.]
MGYLGKKWAVMILLELYKGDEWKRFSDLKDCLSNITSKMLSERLKELEKEGLVENRVDTTTFPIKSEYRLTEPSLELMPVIHALKLWALNWKVDNEPCKDQNCKLCRL